MKEVFSLWVCFLDQETPPVKYSPPALQPGKGWALSDCLLPRDGAWDVFFENSSLKSLWLMMRNCLQTSQCVYSPKNFQFLVFGFLYEGNFISGVYSLTWVLFWSLFLLYFGFVHCDYLGLSVIFVQGFGHYVCMKVYFFSHCLLKDLHLHGNTWFSFSETGFVAVSVCQVLTEAQFSDKMVALYSCLQMLALCVADRCKWEFTQWFV